MPMIICLIEKVESKFGCVSVLKVGDMNVVVVVQASAPKPNNPRKDARGITFNWSWRRLLRTGREERDLVEIRKLCEKAALEDGDERWVWTLDRKGLYTVGSLRSAVDDMSLKRSGVLTKWNKAVPTKVRIHNWRVSLDRLPTKQNLLKRGVVLDNALCPLSKSEPETRDHVFAACWVTIEVRRKLNAWWNLWVENANNHQNSLVQPEGPDQGSKVKEMAKDVVLHTYLWIVWKCRNKVLFNHSPINPCIVANNIQSVAYLWFHNRHFSGRSLCWADWCCLSFPLIWRPWNGKVRKKARKREKCTKSTQKTLGDREVLILAPPSSTELQIRVDLSVWRHQVGSLAIARWSLESRSNCTHKSDHEAEPEQGNPGEAPTHDQGPYLRREKNDSNPIVHMENFVDICDQFKTEADRDDAIRLWVFPLTLIGEARAWLRSLEPSSITTWEGLCSKFLSRFFPPSKIDKLRAEIRSFQQQDGETISEAWERFKHLLNSCPSHELNKSEQVQTFYSGLAYSSRATLDSSAGGVFMYKTPTEGYKLLEDMLIHNIDWRTDKRLQIPRMAGKISTDFDPSDELAAMKNQQVKFERKIEKLIKSVHALQVGCEECNGPHLTKDCPNKPMMTPEEVNYINRGDYQGRWNNNRNFIPRPPGFFAPTQQNQRSDGEPRVSIEDRIIQFMDAQKKLNDEVGSYLRNHQSTIQNLELQVGRVSQMLSERTQGELPTQTQVNQKVENAKPMLMITGEPSKKKWTDIYTKKYVETESESEPNYATYYDSEGFTVSFEHLRLKVPEASSDDEDEEDGKQGGYAEFVIPKKEDKGKEKEKEKKKAPEDDLIYIAPQSSMIQGVTTYLFLVMNLVVLLWKMGVKRIVPTNYQYRGVNGYMTTPLGIAEGVPIRIGKFVYYTDFVIANLPQNTEIPIILGRSFLHTAQVNTDMRNQVTSLGYGDNRIYFDPNGEPVRHLDEPYDDPSLAYTKSMNHPLLPHELGKKTEDISNPMHKKEQSTKEPGSSKKDHRKKRGSSSRRNHTEEIETRFERNQNAMQNSQVGNSRHLAIARFSIWRCQRQRTRSSTTAVANFHAPDGSHVFTSFTNDPTLNVRKKEEYRDIVNRLLPRQILMPKRVDWDLLRSMGVENDIKAILEKHAYDEDGNEYYICHAWERVFDIGETLYRELIVEFVATFRFDAIKALGEFRQSCMTFRLGGVWRSISLVDFALALGIYTQLDVDAPGFEEYMWATAKRPDDFDPSLAWSILGDGVYHGNLKVKGFLASSDRLLHRMLIQAVNARSSSEEKVTVQDLWLLEQLSTDDKYPNAPYLIVAQLAKASGYREGSRIVGGQYVTLLAKHFGILTDAAIASMTNLGEMGLIDMDQLRAYRSQPRSQPRSTHEIGGTSGTSGANVGQQPADWTAYSGYQDLSNQLSEMSLSYGRHQQHMEYNTVEALHQANWQSGVMNQMASHVGIQPNTAYAPSPYWPYSEDAPPGYQTYEDWQNQPRGPY
ncbi:hypothetical protein OSB04_003628 [Centaurea solstitialis]|uniref:Retrotransposon gag domain-containing protein n=1 Tax=Centaurea solstitialis TaxID=347529 RepID=A0AA38WND6_9ASTR|nr:hypothetical protein OSB04_003628 [Centaurea solstitialis]